MSGRTVAAGGWGARRTTAPSTSVKDLVRGRHAQAQLQLFDPSIEIGQRLEHGHLLAAELIFALEQGKPLFERVRFDSERVEHPLLPDEGHAQRGDEQADEEHLHRRSQTDAAARLNFSVLCHVPCQAVPRPLKPARAPACVWLSALSITVVLSRLEFFHHPQLRAARPRVRRDFRIAGANRLPRHQAQPRRARLPQLRHVHRAWHHVIARLLASEFLTARSSSE